MHPTLFTLGKLNVPSYTVLLDLGLILGLLLTYFEGKRLFDSGETALDLGLWAVIGGILGGRIGYVLANWSAFSQEPGRIVRIWEGGLAFHGAFLGGLAVIGIFALLHRKSTPPLSFWVMGDAITPGLSLGLVFGWAACLLGGAAYGALGEGFGYAVLPDLFGVEAPRFATQAFGIGYALLLFLVFWLLRKRWPFAGASFLMFNLFYFTGQFFLEFTRGDEAIYVGPWRLAQVLDLAVALASAGGLLVLWWQANRRMEAAMAAEDATGGPAEAITGIAGVDTAGEEALLQADAGSAGKEERVEDESYGTV